MYKLAGKPEDGFVWLCVVVIYSILCYVQLHTIGCMYIVYNSLIAITATCATARNN